MVRGPMECEGWRPGLAWPMWSRYLPAEALAAVMTAVTLPRK